MKKTILLFLFIIPVIIVVLVVAIAGFVGRRVMFVQIQGVTVDQTIFESRQEFHEQYGSNNLILIAEVGDEIEFLRYLVVQPAEAADQLNFVSSNPDAVQVIDGRIHILQNMRSTDLATGIELQIMHGVETFFTVFVIINLDNNRFDYFGFDHGLFIEGIEQSWIFEMGLSVNFYGRIQIEKNYIASGLNQTIPIGKILERGFNVAPIDLLNLADLQREEFLDSLYFSSSNSEILRIMAVDGYGQFDARVLDVGEVDITITANFRDARFNIVVPIVII